MGITATIDDFEPTQSLESRFRKGVIWNIIAAILAQGANFLTSIVIANLLGRELFGQYGVIRSTLLTLSAMAQVATGITATKYVAELRVRDKVRAGRVLGLCAVVTFANGILTCGVILVASPLLAIRILHAPGLATDLRITAVVALFAVVDAYQTGTLAGLESYKTLAFGSGAQGVLQIALAFMLARHYGLTGALIALILTAAGRWFMFQICIQHEAKRQNIYIHYRGLTKEAEILRRFLVPAAISGMTAPPAIWIGTAVLVRSSAGFGQVALFSAAFNLKSFALFFPLVLNNVGASLLNNQRGWGDEGNYRRVFWINNALTGGSAIIGAGVIAVIGPWLLRLYGKDFEGAYTCLLILMATAVTDSIANAAYQIVQAREKMWISLLVLVLPRDLLLTALAITIVPGRGAVGLSAAHFSASCLYLVLVLVSVWRLGLRVR